MLNIIFVGIFVLSATFLLFGSWLEVAALIFFDVDTLLESTNERISNKHRMAQLIYSFELIRLNPIFGSGLSASFDLFTQEAVISDFGGGGLHNTYLSILINGGLVGSLLHIMWLVSLYKLVKKMSNSSKNALALMRFVLIVIFFTPYSFLSEAILMVPLVVSRSLNKAA
jgi:O-antigen ligase